MKRKLELYIHIPFCVKKCAYCDFLSGPADDRTKENYVAALIKEIKSYVKIAEEYEVSTIFVGGGTPSILEGTQMERIMQTMYETFAVDQEAEITIEANPGTVTLEKLKSYREAGINRISFGLQSVNDEELKMLGRIHTFAEFLLSYEYARKAGFENINIDLISAIPGQSVESWQNTLNKVISLKPEHISAYSLIVEEGTPFYQLYEENKYKEKGYEALPNEEEERSIYKDTERILENAGYYHYEISNYAKIGYACKHNLGYWERKEYLGIGLGAASLIKNVRFSNVTEITSYINAANCGESVCGEKEELTINAQMEEFMFLGLRKIDGISVKDFEDSFHIKIREVYGEVIGKLKEEGLVCVKGNRVFLTEKGIDISNYVLSEFLLD